MIRNYFKTLFKQEGIIFEEDRNSFIIDCGGNGNFISVLDLINKKVETWTYELELALNIKIDTAYEKIIIEYWGG